MHYACSVSSDARSCIWQVAEYSFLLSFFFFSSRVCLKCTSECHPACNIIYSKTTLDELSHVYPRTRTGVVTDCVSLVCKSQKRTSWHLPTKHRPPSYLLPHRRVRAFHFRYPPLRSKIIMPNSICAPGTVRRLRTQSSPKAPPPIMLGGHCAWYSEVFHIHCTCVSFVTFYVCCCVAVLEKL